MTPYQAARTAFITLAVMSLGLAGLSSVWVFQSRADGFQQWWIFAVVAAWALGLAFVCAREVLEH